MSSVRQRILAVAGSMFFNNGYDGTLISGVSKAAETTPPTIYWHFESKAGLLEAFLRTLVDNWTASLAETLSADNPPERLRQFVSGHVVTQLGNYELFDAFGASHGFNDLLSHLDDEINAEIVARARAYVAVLDEILAAGETSNDFRFTDRTVTRQAIMTMAEYSYTWFQPGGRLRIGQVADMYADLALRMVTPQCSDGRAHRPDGR